MSDYEAFVHELIGYIFKVQDKDDDNLSAEIICRKLYKYGLIENVNHEWRMKYRPKHRWPATVHNGRADKEDWQCITIKPIEDEPQTNADQRIQSVESVEPTWTKEEHEAFYNYLWNIINPNEMEEYIAMFESKTEPTISKMEQVDKDINVRIKDEPQTETEIARAIVHKMIDDAIIAEDAYPDLRQQMHDAVDEYEPQTERSGE